MYVLSVRGTSLDIDHLSARWLKRTRDGEGPVYLRIVDALSAAIREGELQAGDQLPPQRTVAALLGIDFTTVTRAYAAARERGLVEGAVGKGTFVRGRSAEDEAGLVDLSMNLPPPPHGLSLAALLRETSAAILQRTDVAALMAYHPGAGSLGQRTAGAAWLAPVLGEVAPECVLVSGGAQTALAALLSMLLAPGDTLVVEPLTYPGLLALANRLGVRLAPCPVDGEGLLPEALERLCAAGAKAVYLIPTLHNPTTTTMSPARRAEIARIARAADVWILEDDPYSLLLDAPPAAVASLAPERTFHVATVSKVLSPGLRTAFVAAPDAALADRLGETLRTLSQMPPPLMTAITASWIREGVAAAVLAGVTQEARARRALAAAVLPRAIGGPESLHVWLDLPPDRDGEGFRDLGRRRGLSLVTAEAFAAGDPVRGGVRISLGGPARRTTLETALRGVAAML